LRPAGPGADFRVERSSAGYTVHGERVERWVHMTDLDNDEAVRYLQGRLLRAGVEDALVAAGARAGDTVEIAGFAFDFEPEPGSDAPQASADEQGKSG
jgi:GTPase